MAGRKPHGLVDLEYMGQYADRATGKDGFYDKIVLSSCH